jgi:two-component system response regulator AtoC
MLIYVLLAVESGAERSRLSKLLDQPDVSVTVAKREGVAVQQLADDDFDVLVVDRGLLPPSPAGLVQSVRDLPEQPEIVVLTDTEDADERASLLASGCLAVLNRKLEDRRLKEALHAVIVRRRGDATSRLRADRPEERYSLEDFVSDSPGMQLFVGMARKVARSSTSVLILGETGVGKERLARAIHAGGPRSEGPFIAVNCGAIPETLLESELFGHEKGSFTGATRSRRGFFELAHKGTLFLDEIGEMPMHLQVKLLRALDERRIYRVGAEKPIEVAPRVMASTNKNLEEDIKRDRFRPDLFYRLAVVTLTIPPLRERREDIARLVEGYLDYFRFQTKKPITTVDGGAMDVMMRYDWPGNVRELVNAMERAFLFASPKGIQVEDLPLRIVTAVTEDGPRPPARAAASDDSRDEAFSRPLSEARKETLAAFETRYLSVLLRRTGGRIDETAARAGITERSLYDLMKRRGLRKEDFRPRRGSRQGSRRTRSPQVDA